MSQIVEYYMGKALEQAKKAYSKGEVPVGCVIVKNGVILATGYNKKEKKNDVSAHAEMIAIRKASKKLKTWRLEECDIYVTLEPCAMCSGAIIQARFRNLYFGAFEYKTGAAGSVLNLFNIPFNHKVQVHSGVLRNESELLIKDFFKKLRK